MPAVLRAREFIAVPVLEVRRGSAHGAEQVQCPTPVWAGFTTSKRSKP